ncbi:hypothetical protein B0H14DRAFT_3514259 [Mycena olivaceomarginata]|nr:hypothetical protein B0H14DRAFT_3514259 [Mycena olivaceomarginata]
MPAPRPTRDFDTMTARSGSSKRSWRSADTAPRASTSSVASSSSSKSESLRVTGILSALAPAHQPRRQTSPAPTHESRRRDSLSPAGRASASHLPRTNPRIMAGPLSHTYCGISTAPLRADRLTHHFSPRASHFPASPRNGWNNRDAQPLSVPAPRSPHYVKGFPDVECHPYKSYPDTDLTSGTLPRAPTTRRHLPPSGALPGLVACPVPRRLRCIRRANP